MKQKVTLSEVSKIIPEGVDLFICMVSFESRCYSILESMTTSPRRCLFFKNVSVGELAEKNLNHMKKLSGDNHSVIELNIDSPITAADAYAKALSAEKGIASTATIFIDTTTFTHEQLLILLRILELVQLNCKILMGYTGAEAYSTNTDTDHVWLSRGVSQVRSVLGYPGRFAPSKKLHLVVLVGFEHERAASVIEQFEPARLTLMRGDPTQSISSQHYDNNKKFFEELTKFVERTQQTQLAVEKLHFSCIDPFSVRDALLTHAKSSDDFNVAVCPMNTKLSTVGVGLAALENDRIQIAYASAIQYNESGYSSPSSSVTIFEYPANKITT